MLRRVLSLLAILVVALGVTTIPADAATGAPAPITTPGGLSREGKTLRVENGRLVQAEQAPGNCSNEGVHCKPVRSGTCTGNTDQNTPPDTIRVLVGTTDPTIEVVKFRDYVADSLYNEWVPTWDGDAVKAGAVAVKSFAWYWITQRYGGYVGSTPSPQTCFDISDDPNFFQKYQAGTGTKDPKTVARVAATWPVAVRVDGQVVETHYVDTYQPDDPEHEPCGLNAGGTPDSYMSQYGTQACNEVNDANNGYRYNVILKLYYGNSIDISTTAQLRTQADFNFTARSTGTTFDNGNWRINDGYPTTFAYGARGDVPFAATDGDGFALAALFRPSNKTFYLANALHHVARIVPFGVTGDQPVPAHYAGLRAATQIAVWRPGNGTWYVAGPTGKIVSATQWGSNGDVPVPGRWLDSNTDSYAVWRPANGTWYVYGGSNTQWGQRGDVPVPADYDGNGTTDVAVYRPVNHTFYVRGRSGGVTWGIAGDVPVTGDFNGDGKADFAVYRPKAHVLLINGQGTAYAGTGTAIGAAPYRG